MTRSLLADALRDPFKDNTDNVASAANNKAIRAEGWTSQAKQSKARHHRMNNLSRQHQKLILLIFGWLWARAGTRCYFWGALSLYSLLSTCFSRCGVEIGSDQATLPYRTTGSTYLGSNVSCVHCTSECQSCPVIPRWLNCLKNYPSPLTYLQLAVGYLKNGPNRHLSFLPWWS